MFVILEGTVMAVISKEYDNKKHMQVSVYQKGSSILEQVKMSIEDCAALNIKEGSPFRQTVQITAYKDNQQNAKLSCKYTKN